MAQMHAVCARAHPQHSIATIMLLSIYFILEPLNFKLILSLIMFDLERGLLLNFVLSIGLINNCLINLFRN